MLLGVTGLIGSGKDTVAEYLTTHYGFTKLSFAASLKDAVSNVFGWNREYLEGTTAASRVWRDTVDTWWAKRLDIPHLTPRWILQYWGTEVCREGFHDDIWIASLENKLARSYGNVVITDCRFINEFRAIKNSGGKTCRITRGERPSWYEWAVTLNTSSSPIARDVAEFNLKKLNIHCSEYASVGLEYDFEIENNYTVEALWETVDEIVHSING
jgi:hypothetical protein